MVRKFRLMYHYFCSIEKRYYIAFFCFLPFFTALGAYLTHHFVIVTYLVFAGYLIGLFHLVFDKWDEGDHLGIIPYARKYPMANTVAHSFFLGWFLGFMVYLEFFIHLKL